MIPILPRCVMYSRGLRILFVLFQLVWLNAVLPGHRRGIVTVPGYEPARTDDSSLQASAQHACCSAAQRESDDSKSEKRQRDRAAHCAVCVFAARLSQAPAIVNEVHAPQFVEFAPPPAAESIVTAEPFHAYFTRGPPLV